MNSFFDIQRFAVYGTNGSDTLGNLDDYVAMYGYGGNDVIDNVGYNVTVNGGSDNDEITNIGSYVTDTRRESPLLQLWG